MSHCIAPNNKMIETEDGAIWKEARGPNLKRCSGIYLEQARRTNNITQSVCSYARWRELLSQALLSTELLSPEPLSPEQHSPEPFSTEPLSPEPLSPEQHSPEPLSPEPLGPELLSPEPLSPELLSPELLSPVKVAVSYSSQN